MGQPRKAFPGRTLTLNRRRLVAGAGSAGALVALSAACGSRGKSGSGAQPSGGTSQKQPKRGGVVSYSGGVGSQDTGGRPIDPNTQTQGGAKSFSLFYERLAAYNI